MNDDISTQNNTPPKKKKSVLKYIFGAITAVGFIAYIGTTSSETLTRDDGTIYTKADLKALDAHAYDPIADFNKPLTPEEQAQQDAAQARFKAIKDAQDQQMQTLRAKWGAAHDNYKRIGAYKIKTIGAMITQSVKLREAYNNAIQLQNDATNPLSVEDSTLIATFPDQYGELVYKIENNIVPLTPSDSMIFIQAIKDLKQINPQDPFQPYFNPK